MAPGRSPKSRYPSKYGLKEHPITAAEWLAQLMCERRASREKRVLSFRFWKRPPWNDIYRQQAVAANRLLSHLDPHDTGTGMKAVLRFLRSPKGRFLYSLAPAFVLPLAEQAHQAVIDEEESAYLAVLEDI